MCVISAFVEHKPGVLQRVAGLFSRRGFNIDEITVGFTEKDDIARMTIVTRGDEKETKQIIKQMNKLVNIIKVSTLDDQNTVSRELSLIKVNTPDERSKSELIQYVDVFRGRIVDVSKTSLTAEITGDSNKTNAFVKLVRGFGIKEMSRTGTTAMEREDKEMK